MQIPTIDAVVRHVQEAGQLAFAEQKMGMIDRHYKSDGSVITCIDKKVEDFLYAEISEAFPAANILSEEAARFFENNKTYTFVIDPIDGTDTFSQGMPGWCVSVGLMENFIPVAGVIYSPALDLLLFADIGQKASLNGKSLACRNVPAQISSKTNIVVSSSLHHQINLGSYPGKIRSIGSAALHLCFPLVYPGIYAAMESRNVHIWDILAAHAICQSHDLALELYTGGNLRYQVLTDGGAVGDPILSGHKTNIDNLRDILAPKL